MPFSGVAIVIGAGSGIGRATAKLFVDRGCLRVAIGDVNSEGLEETKNQMLAVKGGKECEILVQTCDVTSEESVNSFISAAASKLGRIDYACNVAGILMPGASTDYSLDDWDKQLGVNARGMWLCQRAEIIQMLQQEPIKESGSRFASRGAIANVASMAALRAYDNLPAYCASKFAVLGFTKADALRYAKEHVRINAVCPGVIATPMLGEIDPNDTTNIAEMTKDMAMGRQGQPEEVAEGLLWLCSSQASFVTGIGLLATGMVGA